MNEINKTNRKSLAIAICISLFVVVIFVGSYAYWLKKDEQSGTNYIVGSCLNINIINAKDGNNNPIEGMNLSNAFPISDAEGMETEGYTFELENTCDKPVEYQLVLESLEVDGKTVNDYFDGEFVKVKLNNGPINRYSELTPIDGDWTTENGIPIIETSHLFSGTILPKKAGSNQNVVRHNIKMWLSEDAGNDQMNKVFSSKIKVLIGQEIIKPQYALTSEECFVFDEANRIITGYNVDNPNCGTNIVFPAYINGIPVEQIRFADVVSDDLTYVDLSQASNLNMIWGQSFVDYDSIPIYEFTGGYVGSGKDLIMPDNLEYIYPEAFAWFNGNNLILNNSLKSIMDGAFLHYVGTGQDLIIPNSVTTIEAAAFNRFNGNKIVLSNQLTTINQNTFVNYVGSDYELVIPDSVTSIDTMAFRNYDGPKLVLSNNLTTIGYVAFEKFSGKESALIIPNSVQTIGIGAFWKYNNPAPLKLGNNISEIKDTAFWSYEGDGTKLVLPDELTSIGEAAFSNFIGDEIVFNDKLETIGDYAFEHYYKQGVTVYLPSTIKEIGRGVFNEFGANETIVIKKPNLDGITIDQYYGTIKCMDNGQIINCP